MRKSDVEFHTEGYGRKVRPAVNVKVYRGWDSVPLPMCLGRVKDVGETDFHDVMTDPRFDRGWIDDHVTDVVRGDLFGFACESDGSNYPKRLRVSSGPVCLST
jgi:hypothetical protein